MYVKSGVAAVHETVLRAERARVRLSGLESLTDKRKVQGISREPRTCHRGRNAGDATSAVRERPGEHTDAGTGRRVWTPLRSAGTCCGQGPGRGGQFPDPAGADPSGGPATPPGPGPGPPLSDRHSCGAVGSPTLHPLPAMLTLFTQSGYTVVLTTVCTLTKGSVSKAK